ncbi:hypothetical protein [Xenorhabdus bovienii]|uniref:hypothetical protein n=1 Tax=Xenorhabdus bovienii TaxID=40576 RepID=UPI00237CF9A0|nr:hypothetical protein [Xenorhabdus bovienii]
MVDWMHFTIYYLLSNSYLMQDFMMFRSIFHEGAISVNDNDYIKSVGFHITCNEANKNFSLDNEKDVIQDLISQHFIYREGAIHHQLIAYMLENDNTHLDEIISNLFSKSNSDILSAFTILDEKFIHSASFRKLIISTLSQSHHFDKMISILNENELEIIKTKIAINMIAFIDPNVSSHRNVYCDFVVNTGYGLVSHLDKEMIVPFLNNIKELNIVYEDITPSVSDIDYQALTFLAENHMYSLSKDNYRIVISALLKEKSITYEQVGRQPMSLIVENNLQFVRQYVDENIDLFVRNIFIDSEEETATIVKILQHTELCDELKTQIIKEMSFAVSELTEFSETIDSGETEISFHDLFYRHDRILPTWPALIAYICEECNLEVLTGYVERHAENLGSQDVQIDNEDRYDLLYTKVICNEDLNDEAYAAVLSPIYINIHYWDERFSIYNFSRLVNNNKLSLNNEIFEKASELFIPSTENFVTESFVVWFSLHKEEFFSETDYYLHKDDNETFFEGMIHTLVKSERFSTIEKADLLIKYQLKLSNSFMGQLDISNDVIISIIVRSSDDENNIKMIIRLLKNGYDIKADIANLVKYLDEKEFSKIFNNKREATMNISRQENYNTLLIEFKRAGFIKDFSIKDDGKFYVKISS